MGEFLEQPRWNLLSKFFGGFLLLILLGTIVISHWVPVGSQEFLSLTIQYLAAAGTLSLATGTFYSVLQSKRVLELREQQREKPLAVDELSNIILPAIQSVSENLEMLQENDKGIDWVYFRGTSSYDVLAQPRSAIPVRDVVALQRLSEHNRELYQKLIKHEQLTQQLGEIAQEIFDSVEPSVIEHMTAEGFNEEDFAQSNKAIVQGMISGVEKFGSHDLANFWEENHDALFEILDDEAGELVEELNRVEGRYERHCEKLLEDLQEYQMGLQTEFGISTEEIEQADIDSVPINRY